MKIFKVNCSVCGKEIEVCEDDRKFPKREKYFCSRACSNTRIRTEEIKRKISNTLKQKVKPHYCKYCGKEIFGKRKYCSDICLKLEKTKNSRNQKLKVYLSYCNFLFSLNDYPNEFDFEIIKKYGWYKPKNHGDNLNGISRDHKFSRMMGWELKIDPYIISHPANCELLQHKNNISKHKKCSISLSDLILNINNWNDKYGFYENKIDYKIFEDLGIKFSVLYNENKK